MLKGETDKVKMELVGTLCTPSSKQKERLEGGDRRDLSQEEFPGRDMALLKAEKGR